MSNIQQTKDAVEFICALVMSAGKSLEDGKLSLGDITNFFDSLTLLPTAISGINEIATEISDIDDEEKNELLEIISLKVDLPANQNMEKWLEAILKGATHLLPLIGAFIKK